MHIMVIDVTDADYKYAHTTRTTAEQFLRDNADADQGFLAVVLDRVREFGHAVLALGAGGNWHIKRVDVVFEVYEETRSVYAADPEGRTGMVRLGEPGAERLMAAEGNVRLVRYAMEKAIALWGDCELVDAMEGRR